MAKRRRRKQTAEERATKASYDKNVASSTINETFEQYKGIASIKRFIISNYFVLALIIAGAITRFHKIGKESLWLDEVCSISLSQTASLQQLIDHFRYTTWYDPHPIFYYFVLNYWTEVFGISEVALRSLSAIIGVMIIIITYYIGKKMVDNNVGIVASLLVLMNPINIWYSQEARMYALTSLLILLSTYIFFKFLSQNFKYSFHYILVSAILIYTDYIGFLVLGAHMLFGLINFHFSDLDRTKIFKNLLKVYAAIFILYIPWIPSLLATLSKGGSGWMVAPTIGQAFDEFIYVIGIRPSEVEAFLGTTVPKFIFTVFIFIIVLIFLIGIVKSLLRIKDFTTLIAMVSIIPLIMLIISIYIIPIYNIRQISPFVPEICIMIAIGLAYVRDYLFKLNGDISARSIYLLILFMLIVFNSISINNIYTTETKENWRGVAHYIVANDQEGDIILVNAAYCLDPFNYYFDSHGSVPVYGVGDFAEAKAKIQGYKRAWLVLSYSSITAEDLTELRRLGYSDIMIGEDRGIILVRAGV